MQIRIHDLEWLGKSSLEEKSVEGVYLDPDINTVIVVSGQQVLVVTLPQD